jgi:antitoxin component YwqK of YwqJK toxin-antitoxin module
MKKLLPLLSVLFLISVGFGQTDFKVTNSINWVNGVMTEISDTTYIEKEYIVNDLIEMDNGLWTEKFSDKPITGKVFGYFGENEPLKKVHMGNIRNGKKEGKYISYHHSTGRKSLEEYFMDGKLDGLRTTWFKNGQKKFKGTYKDDIPEGSYTIWYENGQKKYEGNTKDNKRDGLSTNWYEDGQKSSETFYKDDKVDGLFIKWYESNELYENEQKKYEGTYKNGIQDGLWTWWYGNGKKKNEGTYKDGKEDGLWTWWYENGQKEEEGTYKDGKEDGLYTIWDKNGVVITEERYNNGEIDCSYLSKTRMGIGLLNLQTTLKEFYNQNGDYPEYPFDSFYVMGTEIPDCYLEGSSDKKTGHWVTKGSTIYYGKNNEWIYDYNTGKISKLP